MAHIGHLGGTAKNAGPHRLTSDGARAIGRVSLVTRWGEADAIRFHCGHPRSGNTVRVHDQRRTRAGVVKYTRDRCRRCMAEAKRRSAAVLKLAVTPCARCGLRGDHKCIDSIVETALRRVA